MSIAFENPEITLQKLRERLCKMSDQELIQFGKTVRGLSGPRVSAFPDPWQAQLEEARAEWRQRHPKALKGRRLEERSVVQVSTPPRSQSERLIANVTPVEGLATQQKKPQANAKEGLSVEEVRVSVNKAIDLGPKCMRGRSAVPQTLLTV